MTTLLDEIRAKGEPKQAAPQSVGGDDDLLADIRAKAGGSQPSEGRTAPWGKTYGADSCVTYVKDYLKHNYGKSVSNLRSLKAVGPEYIRPGAVLELSPIGEYTVPHWAVVNPDGKTVSEFQSNKKNGKSYPIGIKNSRTVDELRGRIKAVRVIPAADVQKQPAKPLTQEQQWQGGWQFAQPQMDTRTAAASGMGYSGGPGGGTRPQAKQKPTAPKQKPILDMIPREPALTKQDVTARNKAINERMWALTREVNSRVFPEPMKQFDENEYKYLLSRLKEPWEQEYVKRGVDEELRRQGTEPSTREGLVSGLLMAGSGVNLGVGGLVSRAAAKPGIVGKAAGAVEKAIKPIAQAAQQTGKTGLAARTVERIPRGAAENVLFEAVANPSELRERALPAAALGAAGAGGLGGVMDVAGGMKPHVRPAAEPPAAARPVAPLAEAPATLEAMARARTAAQSQYRADVRRLKPPVEATPGRATTPLPKVGEAGDVVTVYRGKTGREGERFLVSRDRKVAESHGPVETYQVPRSVLKSGQEELAFYDGNVPPDKVGSIEAWVRQSDITPAVAESRVAPWTEPQTPPMQGARMAEASKVEVAKPASTVVTQARPTEYRVKIYEDDRGKFWIEPWGKSPKSGKWEKMFNRVSPEFMDEYFRAEGIDLSTLPKTEVVWDAPKKKYVPRAKPSVTPVEPPVAAKPTAEPVAPKAAAETGVAKPPPAKAKTGVELMADEDAVAAAASREKVRANTGLTKTQEEYLADKLVKAVETTDNKIGPDGVHFEEPVTIKVPGDGQFAVADIDGANNLYYILTGKTLEGTAKATASRGMGSTRLPAQTPSLQHEADVAMKTYGMPDEAIATLRRQAEYLERDPRTALDAKGKARLETLIGELERRRAPGKDGLTAEGRMNLLRAGYDSAAWVEAQSTLKYERSPSYSKPNPAKVAAAEAEVARLKAIADAPTKPAKPTARAVSEGALKAASEAKPGGQGRRGGSGVGRGSERRARPYQEAREHTQAEDRR